MKIEPTSVGFIFAMMIFIWCYWQACLVFTGRFSCSMRPVNAIQLILYQVTCTFTLPCSLPFQFSTCLHPSLFTTRRPSKPKTSQRKFIRSASVCELLHVICLCFYSEFRPYILDRLRLFCIKKTFWTHFQSPYCFTGRILYFQSIK